MEADEYFTAYDALKQDEHSRRAELKIADPSPVHKVVWSSFDFMTGPEMRFVWEVSPGDSLSPVNVSSEGGSGVSDATSMQSSISNASSVPLEQIDDPLQDDLLSAAVAGEGVGGVGGGGGGCLDDSLYDYYTSSPMAGEFQYSGRLRYLDDYMQSSSTMTSSMSESRSTATTETLTPSVARGGGGGGGGREEDRLSSLRGDVNGSRRGSVGDPLCGTPIDTLDISALLDASLRVDGGVGGGGEEAQSPSSSEKRPSAHSTSSGDTIRTRRSSFGGEEMAEGEDGCDVLITSCVDSGIAPTISTHSDLGGPLAGLRDDAGAQSALWSSRSEGGGGVGGMGGLTALADDSMYGRWPSSSFSSPATGEGGLEEEEGEGDDVCDEMAWEMAADEYDAGSSDEAWVAKAVLAEQICSPQLPSQPVSMKTTLVASRKLLTGSFIFAHKDSYGRRSMHAISLLLSDSESSWYMQRQAAVQLMFTELVPRLRASMWAEDRDDVLVRLTGELRRLLGLLAALDRWPLVEGDVVRLKHTLFSGRATSSNGVLDKAIAGCMQSQGRVVVIGSDAAAVGKLLRSLHPLVPVEWQWCCIRPSRAHKYSPYLRLQAVNREELPYVLHAGCRSAWPICVVDMDRNTVCMSAPFPRHEKTKRRAELAAIRAVLGHTELGRKDTKLELRAVSVPECVRRLLARMDALPMEEGARRGLLDQFCLSWHAAGAAFVDYVRDASEPLSHEKSHRSARWSLRECRRALHLQHDGWLEAVIASAEMQCEQITAFVYEM